MMLTMLPDGPVSVLARSSVVGVEAWSSLTMCWCTVERVASASTGAKVVAWIVAKAMTLEVCMMGCSCKLGMILANLVLGSRWFVEEELDAVVAKCNLLVLLIVHFCVRALPSFQLRLGIHWSNDLGPSHGNRKWCFSLRPPFSLRPFW